jgi:hypothetical protein
MINLAFLISAHTDEAHLKRLVDALPESADFYIHIDQKSDIDKFKTIHCFIAGSTELKQERRSFCYVMSRLHNQWRNRNFAIESYSYEDFPRSVHQKSQQSIYDDFIKNKSDIVMFVFDTTIGNITLNELNVEHAGAWKLVKFNYNYISDLKY